MVIFINIKIKQLSVCVKQKFYCYVVKLAYFLLKFYKKLLQTVTLYNSRVDILFASLEYLEFINNITNKLGKTEIN